RRSSDLLTQKRVVGGRALRAIDHASSLPYAYDIPDPPGFQVRRHPGSAGFPGQVLREASREDSWDHDAVVPVPPVELVSSGPVPGRTIDVRKSGMHQRRSTVVAVVVVLITVVAAAALVYSGVRQTRVVVDAEPTGRVVS